MMKRKMLWKRREPGRFGACSFRKDDEEICAFLANRSLRREKEDDMKKFLKYVVPSVLAFALSGIYAIVDGFFVGNSVGDVGLSAINVVYPVVTLMQSATRNRNGRCSHVDGTTQRDKGGRRRVCAYSAAAAASDEYCTDGCDADLYGSGAVLSGGRGDDPSPGRGISADHGLRDDLFRCLRQALCR